MTPEQTFRPSKLEQRIPPMREIELEATLFNLEYTYRHANVEIRKKLEPIIREYVDKYHFATGLHHKLAKKDIWASWEIRI